MQPNELTRFFPPSTYFLCMSFHLLLTKHFLWSTFSSNFDLDFGNDIHTQQQQIQYVPPVHEADITYTVPARQSLTKPIIGGSAPVTQFLTPQPQFVYVTASAPNINGNGAGGQFLATQAALGGGGRGSKLTMYEEEQLLQQHLHRQRIHEQGHFVQPEAQKSNYVQIFTPAP